MRRGSWFNTFTAEGGNLDLPAETREELARLDDKLSAIWNLGDNVLIGWTRSAGTLLVLSVRHYAIPEAVHAGAARGNEIRDGMRGGMDDAPRFINEVLSGPKQLSPAEFKRICRAFDCEPEAVHVTLRLEDERLAALVSDMVRCYGVSLVRNRAVILLDIVKFSVQSPLDQMAMLNSLAYSVNSAYGQLLSKDIRINFARTTTGDGFYIWNRATTAGANAELYKLMMMILADNAAARGKARSSWAPKLRAAFHVGEHYEFHQVEGINPTSVTYIVGQVTVDLSRMVELALPGQILIGDFVTETGGDTRGRPAQQDTLDFVENTAGTLDQLKGLEISGGHIENIRCYITGPSLGDGQFQVNRYHLRDKHGITRAVYNAKINIHRDQAESIFLGIRDNDLQAFNTSKVESLSRDTAAAGSLFIRQQTA
jgi:class 3 adenylate cyclase